MKLLNCMIIASILCFAGCSKPAQPDPKPESVMQPTVDANHAGDEGAAKDAASPDTAPNEPKDAKPNDAAAETTDAADVPQAKPRPQAVFPSKRKAAFPVLRKLPLTVPGKRPAPSGRSCCD